jgi:dynein heavy chain 2
LREDFGQKTSQAEILKRDLIKEENILSSAQSLLSKLGDEKVRWEEQSKSIELEFKNFPSESLLASAFTIYLSNSDEN